MDFLSRERVSHSIQALLLFLNISKEAKSLGAELAHSIRERCLDLLGELAAGQIDGAKGTLTLNALIEEMNATLAAPYPTLPTDTFENYVKGEIVAFEHYLNQELKAKHLTVQQEAPLFNMSLTLWEQVGTSLTAQQGASELSALVEKLNTFLPESERYPNPEN